MGNASYTVAVHSDETIKTMVSNCMDSEIVGSEIVGSGFTSSQNEKENRIKCEVVKTPDLPLLNIPCFEKYKE